MPVNQPKWSKQSILFTIFVGLVSIGCLITICAPFLFLLVFTFGDNPVPDAVVDRTYTVGANRIREQIYPRGINWPDQKYEHIYSLENGDRRIELERFTNEEMQSGISKTQPKMVGEWLVIFSADRTFLWKSVSNSIEFSPTQSEGWNDYVLRNLDSYGIYHAKDFSIEGTRWIFEYQCQNLPCPQMKDNKTPPAKIRFFSDDRGKTFQIIKDVD
jgi:hypothetical protein